MDFKVAVGETCVEWNMFSLQTLIDLCWIVNISRGFTAFWERLLQCLSVHFLNLPLDISPSNVYSRMQLYKLINFPFSVLKQLYKFCFLLFYLFLFYLWSWGQLRSKKLISYVSLLWKVANKSLLPMHVGITFILCAGLTSEL